MDKYKQISELLEKRISHGDYFADELPTENNLALEIGVSRMTARKAIMHLIERGVVIRKENGRLACPPGRKAEVNQVALLAPAWPSMEFQIWRFELERAAMEEGIGLRPIDYVHWDDPAIIQTLEGFGAVFLLPAGGQIPRLVLDRLRHHPRVVVLGQDLSTHGLISINLFPPAHINKLLDLLRDAGCRRIDCLCAQPFDDTTDARIRQWRLWLRLTQSEGQLIAEDSIPYSSTIENADRLVASHLMATTLPDAIFSVTIGGAIGAVRACVDHGLTVGRDIMVCAVNGQGMNRYLTPSLTCLESGEFSPYLKTIFAWIRDPAQEWDGPTLLQAEEPTLFIGESTGSIKPTRKLGHGHKTNGVVNKNKEKVK